MSTRLAVLFVGLSWLFWSASIVRADEPIESGLERLCSVYQMRSEQNMQRFKSHFRAAGASSTHWQLELWEDLLFLQTQCPSLEPKLDVACSLGLHLLTAQRGYLSGQNWVRTSTGEEAPLLLEIGDQVDGLCAAPVMAVQGALERLQASEIMLPRVGEPSALAFNAQEWLIPQGVKGTSFSTQK